MATPHAQEKHRARKRIAVTLLHHRRPKRKQVALPRVPPLPLTQAPPGIHHVVPMPGPVPQHVSQQLRSAAPAWVAVCLKCGKSAGGTGRWLKLVHSPCSAPAADLRREFGSHELVRAPVGWQCRRCQLPVPSSRRAAASRSRCPVPAVYEGQVRHMEAESWLCRQQRLPTEWKTANCRPTPADLRRRQQAPVCAPPPPVIAAPAAAALRWKNHLAIQHNVTRQWVCMACGVRRGSFAKLLSLPCSGWEPRLPKALALAIRAGAFDVSLASASRPVRVTAEARGWRPIAAVDEGAPALSTAPLAWSLSPAAARGSPQPTNSSAVDPVASSGGGERVLPPPTGAQQSRQLSLRSLSNDPGLAPASQALAAVAPSTGPSLLASMLAPSQGSPASLAGGGALAHGAPAVAGGSGAEVQSLRANAKRAAPAEQLSNHCKRVRLAHGARIKLALAGGALSDEPSMAREVEPLGHRRGLKRVSFCPVVEIAHFEPPGHFDFPLARRRRGQPALTASSGAATEIEAQAEPVLVDVADVPASASSSALSPTSTEPCTLSPPVANLHACSAPGQGPRRPAAGSSHIVVPASDPQRPPAAADLPLGAPHCLGAPARAHSAAAAAPACTVASANVVPARTASGSNGGARARRPVSRNRATAGDSDVRPGQSCPRQSGSGQSPAQSAVGGVHVVVPNSQTQQPTGAASHPFGAPSLLGAPACVHSAAAAAPACSVAPANAVLVHNASGTGVDARARRPVSMDRDSLQTNVRAATGGVARTGSRGSCPRQLTLADFWR